MPQLSASNIFDNKHIHGNWHEAWEAKESAMKSRLVRSCEQLNSHAKQLDPLMLGDKVFIQNQDPSSRAPRKWDKQGTVVEVGDFDQYRVRVAGSGRVTLRNRKFLRKFKERELTSNLPDSVATSPKQPYPPLQQVVTAPDSLCSTHPDSPCSTHPGDNNDLVSPDDIASAGDVVSPDTSEVEVSERTPLQTVGRTPLMLKNLQSYNNPGVVDLPSSDAPDFSETSYFDTQLDDDLTSNCDYQEPRRSSRAKSTRKMYDASTGKYK